MVFQNNLLSGAGGSGTTTYAIGQSIRFNDDDSAYLSRTPSSEGNRKKWTLSTWFKLGNSGLNQNFDGLFSAVTSASAFVTIWVNNATYNLDFIQYNGGTTYRVNTPLLTKDPSAWYHAVFVYDSGNAQSTERMRIYLNGLRVTDLYQESQPSLNYDSQVNATSTLHNIGRAYSSGTYSTYYFDGYQTEIHLLDGYAYDPSNFGEFNSSGIWIPKEYTGSYGTNGFKIDGRDSSDLGDDESGNGNDYATSGLASHDQVLDTPTNNFCVLTPLASLMDSGSTLSNGNLKIVLSGNDQFHSNFEISEKSSCEVRLDASSNYGGDLGFGTFQGTDDDDNTIAFSMNYLNGRINLGNGSSGGDVGGNVSVGDIIMMALDPDTRKWWVGVNGTWRNSGDPAGGTGHVYQYATDYFDPSSSYSTTEGIGALVWGGFKGSANGMTVTWNFGQEGTFGGQETAGGNSDSNGNGNFKYTVPSGFKALCSKSMGS